MGQRKVQAICTVGRSGCTICAGRANRFPVTIALATPSVSKICGLFWPVVQRGRTAYPIGQSAFAEAFRPRTGYLDDLITGPQKA